MAPAAGDKGPAEWHPAPRWTETVRGLLVDWTETVTAKFLDRSSMDQPRHSINWMPMGTAIWTILRLRTRETKGGRHREPGLARLREINQNRLPVLDQALAINHALEPTLLWQNASLTRRQSLRSPLG